MSIKVSTYIETIGSESYRNFILSEFDYNMLYWVEGKDKNGNLKININQDLTMNLFEDWRGKNMGSYYKFTNDNVSIEFYSHNYKINSSLSISPYVLPLPLTINDFINDMNRLGIELHWNEKIDDYFEPKDYLHKDEISTYFMNLLNSIEKGHELKIGE